MNFYEWKKRAHPVNNQPTREEGDARRSLADVLRRAIEASGLSHNELAKRAGVASQGVMRFVKGERGLTLVVADRLCEALGLSLYSDRKVRKLRARVRRAELRSSVRRPTGEVNIHRTISGAPESPDSASEGL
ncbi:helix-turn-helix domain-containing protein [Tundrisphaera sp. TA3]|uniref:helix-turn-helix domain-containing protein n=1 Tax=Tundrisphaera sp. TA3 TaxID=3435775 RepID=UPI003EB8BC5A